MKPHKVLATRHKIWAVIMSLAVMCVTNASGATGEKSVQKYGKTAQVIYAPKPDYPYEARAEGQIGAGIAVVRVDISSGRVTEAIMARSTGYRLLDDAALSAFRRWIFQPGSTRIAKIPVTFTVRGGVVITDYKVKESRPLEQLLAPILGSGTLVYGPQPRYPMYPVWTEREGRGKYELHVAKDGKVEGVKILKSSGDATFDRITLNTLRKWRLRKGPLIVELPLGFRMTPNTYDVYIP